MFWRLSTLVWQVQPSGQQSLALPVHQFRLKGPLYTQSSVLESTALQHSHNKRLKEDVTHQLYPSCKD